MSALWHYIGGPFPKIGNLRATISGGTSRDSHAPIERQVWKSFLSDGRLEGFFVPWPTSSLLTSTVPKLCSVGPDNVTRRRASETPKESELKELRI